MEQETDTDLLRLIRAADNETIRLQGLTGGKIKLQTHMAILQRYGLLDNSSLAAYQQYLAREKTKNEATLTEIENKICSYKRQHPLVYFLARLNELFSPR